MTGILLSPKQQGNKDVASTSARTNKSANGASKQNKISAKNIKHKSESLPETKKLSSSPDDHPNKKHQRRLLIEAKVKQLRESTASESSEVKQGNPSSNWQMMKQILESTNSPGKKRRREKSTKVQIEMNKRPKHITNRTDVTNESSSSPTPHEENIARHSQNKENWIDSIVETIKKQERDSVQNNNNKKVAWFDNVDPHLLEDDVVIEGNDGGDANESKSKKKHTRRDEKVQENMQRHAVALDCEMVGVGIDGTDSALARVSIVDMSGKVLCDKYVKPMESIKDYRTKYSGIRPENLVNAPPFKQVQLEVANIIKDKLLVGHALKNDMQCLMFSHPIHLIRDTSVYKPFRAMYNRFTPSLKNLCRDVLGVKIQEGEHSSVIDAKAAMRLYMMHRVAWETNLASGGRAHFKKATMSGAKRIRGAPSSRKKKNYKGGRGGRRTVHKQKK